MTEIVLGTAQLGSHYGIASRGQPDRRTSAAMLALATKGGVTALDTAPRYGDAEEIIGDLGTDLAVFTKVEQSDVRASVRRSLHRLRRCSIDVLFLHESAAVIDDPDGLLTQASALVGEVVGAVGVSTYTEEEFSAAIDDRRISYLQAPCNVADRRLIDSGLLERAARRGMKVFGRSALLQGALVLAEEALPAHLQPLAGIRRRLDELALMHEATVEEVLLRFVISVNGMTGVVVGCDTVEQLGANLASLNRGPLPRDLLGALLDLPMLPTSVIDPRSWPRQTGSSS